MVLVKNGDDVREFHQRFGGANDAHLLDRGWDQTRGQQSCPTGAMRAIKIEDEEMARLARAQELEVLKPELGTRPRVYYRNLWRYSKCFIGGSVAEERQGVLDCIEGASVLHEFLAVIADTHRSARPAPSSAGRRRGKRMSP